jgi:hypothetical protein
MHLKRSRRKELNNIERNKELMQYYKIMISDEDGTAYDYIAVNDSNELESQIQSFASDFPSNTIDDVTVMEVTVEECLREETERIEHIIFDYYFKRNYNPDVVTLREYANMNKKFKADPDFRWQVLKFFQRGD